MRFDHILKTSEVYELIKYVGPEVTILVLGENGTGKTSLMHQAARDPFYKDHIMSLVECTQLSDGSVWMPDIDRAKGVSRELPNEMFGVTNTNQYGMDGSKPVFICFDEILKPVQFIKNMIAAPIHERRIGTKRFPEGSIVVGLSNNMDEGLGDSLQPHLRSRMCLVQMLKPTMEEWVNDFAIPAKLNSAVIACAHENPRMFDSYIDFEQGGKYQGKQQEKENPWIFNPRVAQDGFVSPRTLHMASKIVNKKDNLPGRALDAGLDGALGRAGGRTMASFVRFIDDITSYERVIADPLKAPVTSNPTAQMVQVFQFITRTDTREQASAVVTYVKRMKNEMQSLFVRNVANSQRIVTFANAPGFSAMLSDNKIYLGGVK